MTSAIGAKPVLRGRLVVLVFALLPFVAVEAPLTGSEPFSEPLGGGIEWPFMMVVAMALLLLRAVACFASEI
jgi:hypothetical protein